MNLFPVGVDVSGCVTLKEPFGSSSFKSESDEKGLDKSIDLVPNKELSKLGVPDWKQIGYNNGQKERHTQCDTKIDNCHIT